MELIIECKNGGKLKCPADIAKMSITIRDLIECIDDGDTVIPLQTLPQDHVERAFGLCKLHEHDEHLKAAALTTEEDKAKMEEWKKVPVPPEDQTLLGQTELDLAKFTMSANYLNIPLVLALCIKYTAQTVKTNEWPNDTWRARDDQPPTEAETAKLKDRYPFLFE
jgi:hypothetical protein